MSPALVLYRLVTRLLEPLAPRLLDARAKQGKEDPARVDERLGRASVARPEGDLVWLHGVSVGETLSLLPVVERLRRQRPDLSVLVTSGTLTSATLLARRLPDGVFHQLVLHHQAGERLGGLGPHYGILGTGSQLRQVNLSLARIVLRSRLNQNLG